MNTELAHYVYPKRKAVEHIGADGGPLDNRMQVVFEDAKEGKRRDG